MKPIINYLNAQILRNSQLFERAYGLTMPVQREEKVYPAQYCKGELVEVSNFDNHNGQLYWKLTSDISLSLLDGLASAEQFYEMTIPLQIVAAVPDSKFPIKDAHREQRAANEVIKVISNENHRYQVKKLVKARSSRVNVTAIGLNRNDIISDEYQNIDRAKVNYEYAYFTIDVSVVLQINGTCLEDVCDSSQIGDYDILDWSAADFNVNKNR